MAFLRLKLYPRLGSHPLRPELDPLHMSFAEFGNPENFRQVFERFTTLFQDLPSVRDRTMLGSGFDVLHFSEPGVTLERYYKRFLDRLRLREPIAPA